jgi:hypothetical protein
MAKNAYYGPVYLRRQAEPFMTLSFAGAQREYGVIVVEVGLKLISDVLRKMGVGQNGAAYAQDRVIAHSDLNMLVVRDADGRSTGLSVERKFSDAARVHEARIERSGANVARDGSGREMLTAHAAVGAGDLGWMLFAEVPVEEGPITAHAQQDDRLRSLSIEILSLKAEAAATRIRQFSRRSKAKSAGRRSCRGLRAASISGGSMDRGYCAKYRRSPI